VIFAPSWSRHDPFLKPERSPGTRNPRWKDVGRVPNCGTVLIASAGSPPTRNDDTPVSVSRARTGHCFDIRLVAVISTPLQFERLDCGCVAKKKGGTGFATDTAPD